SFTQKLKGILPSARLCGLLLLREPYLHHHRKMIGRIFQVLGIRQHPVLQNLSILIGEYVINPSGYWSGEFISIKGAFRSEYHALAAVPAVVELSRKPPYGLGVRLQVQVPHQQQRKALLVQVLDLLNDQLGTFTAGKISPVIEMGVEHPEFLPRILLPELGIGTHPFIGGVPAL